MPIRNALIKPLVRSSWRKGPGYVSHWFGKRCDAAGLTTVEVPRLRRVYVHKRVAEAFREVLLSIAAAGIDHLIDLSDYGGTYCCRKVRGGSAASPHSWGIAIDLNVHHFLASDDTEIVKTGRTNFHCAAHEVAPSLEALAPFFNAWGFTWGGDWNTKYLDPMHFEATELTVKILEGGLSKDEHRYIETIREALGMPPLGYGTGQAIKVVHWVTGDMLAEFELPAGIRRLCENGDHIEDQGKLYVE